MNTIEDQIKLASARNKPDEQIAEELGIPLSIVQSVLDPFRLPIKISSIEIVRPKQTGKERELKMTINGGVSREDALASVGAGWARLVNQIYDLAEPHFSEDIAEWAGITQVKEKFGGLTVYTYGLGTEIVSKIDEICYQSGTVCEVCGDPGELRGVSWLKTLCDDCQGVHWNEQETKNEQP